MNRRALIAASLTAALLTTTAACGGGADSADGRLPVVASFYPVAWLAERIGGANVSVSTLTKPGAEPHDLELSPRQVAQITDTKLTVYVKGVQPAVDDAVSQHAGDRALDAASLVKTLPAAPEPEGEEEEEGHADVAYDPHVWLDPARMAVIATALGDRLAEADPGHAAGYKADAAKLASELTALDGAFAGGLKNCTAREFVTAHSAFGYLADRYGLKQIGIAGIDPEAEPSPRRLAELRDEIKRTGVTTVFTETLVSPKIAQTLADSAGVETAVLDPVEGVRPGSSDDYLTIQNRNLSALGTALGCK
ncbi:metal ABC transporter substrate-binding protein [Actinocorallia longicatena]|uniref:Zinc ABC transporter substrate-binding protein n=1 Tax=Actinocorallia longicatena TaxID=111803 RepID=A0ABP6QRU0_9ACTN